MLVHAVARVDDGRVEPARVREQVRGARRLVPHDDRVRAHRLERQRRVLERLALDTLDPLAEKLMTSADSRFAAVSKEMRVRVESS